MTHSEKLIVRYLLQEAANHERAAAAEDLIEPEEESVRIHTVSEGQWTNPGPDCKLIPRLHLSALLVPSTFALFLTCAVLVSDMLLVTRYYHSNKMLCLATVMFLHAPCLPFFVTRMYFLVKHSTVPSKFVKVVVGVWYVATFPLLHLLPLLMLASALFDKALMILGDPSDTRPFVSRQEEVAFGDLVWVAVVHCFPQCVLQLYVLLFDSSLHKVSRDSTAVLQLLSTITCVLLAASVAAFYTKYVPPCSEEGTDGSTTGETTFEGYHDHCAAYILKLLSWIFLIAARVIAGATLLSSYPSPALAGLLFFHVPFVVVWSFICHTTYHAKRLLEDAALGIITMVVVLNYRNVRREGLATLMVWVIFVSTIFLEDTVCLAVTYFTTAIQQGFALMLVGTHYALMTAGVVFLMWHLKTKSCRKSTLRF